MSFAQPFSNYEILARIGSGAMGTVFKARQKHMDRVVALKVLKPALARDTRYVDRLRREARIVGQLSHPNIVTGYDLGEEGGYHFFVMELVEGRSLRQLLAEWGGFPEEQVLDVAIQIAEALDHAWQRGVIHRDIKPGNVLITEDGRVKLTDMGLAKGATDLTLTRHGATVGTPQYISPEQARDPSSVDVRSDLYSLGATLFHMATGQPPFRADSIGELISQVVGDQPAPLVHDIDPELSEGLGLVIRKLLAKDPALRYQTPRELLEDLERVRRAERPRVDVSALAREGRKRRLPRRAWAGAALLVVVVATALAVPWSGGGDPPGPSPEEEIAAFRRTVLDILAPTSDQGFPARLARLNELRSRTEDRAKLDVLDEEARRLARDLQARIDAVCDRFVGERRAETEQWLADPGHWTDADGFLREVAAPAIAEVAGYAPAELPDPALRAAVAERLRELRADVASMVEKRDASYARRYQRFVREDVERPVRARLAAHDFDGAVALLDERFGSFHGRENRPSAEDLDAALRAQIDDLRDGVRERLESEIRAAQATAGTRIRQEAASRIEALVRLRDELRASGDAPGPLREAIERAERELRRHHPPSDAFTDASLDPWPEVDARLRALRSDLAELERRFDDHVIDGLLTLAYRVFADAGPEQAARVLSAAREFVPPSEARRQAHVAAFERASRFRGRLLEALLGEEDIARVAGVVLRADESGPRVLAADGGETIPPTSIDFERLFAAAPPEFRERVATDVDLREGRAFWRFAHGEPARAQQLLPETALGFYAEQVWPRLEAIGDGSGDDPEAAAALARAHEARSQGDHARVRVLLDEFSDRFAETRVGSESAAARSALAEWVRLEERRAAIRSTLGRRVPPGMTVEVEDDEQVHLAARVGDLGAAVRPQDWVARDGALYLEVPPLDPNDARVRRLELAAPFAPDSDLALRAELSFPRAGQDPRIVVVELRGFALVLCALPSGALAAAVVEGSEAFDPDALERALSAPILNAPAAPQVVPGAFVEVALHVEFRRGREASVRATLPGQAGVELCAARLDVPPNVAPVVRIGGFQAFGVRSIELEGRAERP